MKTVEVGDKIYVSQVSSFLREVNPNISEYEVVRANGTSIYAKEDGTEREMRFNRRTGEYKDSLSTYKAFKTEEEYWKQLEEQKKEKELRQELLEKVAILTVKEMEDLKKHLNKR